MTVKVCALGGAGVDLACLIVQHFVRMVVGLDPQQPHGGTILCLPAEGDGSIGEIESRVLPQYGFARGEPRRRFLTLVVSLINAIAAAQGTRPERGTVGWGEYVNNTDAQVRESVESDRTRHRSAYRLCNAVHDGLAIVVSHGGTVRFIRRYEGEVTYWDLSTSVLEV